MESSMSTSESLNEAIIADMVEAARASAPDVFEALDHMEKALGYPPVEWHYVTTGGGFLFGRPQDIVFRFRKNTSESL